MEQKEFEQLPEQIYSKEIWLLQELESLEKLRNEVKEIENIHSLNISMMTDINGKKKFSNETQRRAALNQTLEKDKNFQELKKKLYDKETSFKYEMANRDFLKRKFRLFESLARRD